MLRFLTLALLLVFFPHVTSSQGIVTGRVTEAGTLQPVPGVHVLTGTGSGTVTGGDGWYLLRVDSGRTTITYRFIGYRTEQRDLLVSTADTVILDILLSPDVTTLNEIVVTAGRAEQRLSELTVSMTLIKPYIISRNHIVSADELIDRTPGIEILDGQASIRGGSGYSYGAGSRVLALIDGLPMMSADAGNIKWHTLPLENIGRIEVIKGASSVLYGSSALNGIINFISREPEDIPVTQASVSAMVFGNPRNDEWKWWDTPRTTYSASVAHSGIYNGTSVSAGLKIVDDYGYRKLDDERYGRMSLRLGRNAKGNERVRYGINLNTTLTAKTDFLLWEDGTTGALKQSPSTAMAFRGTSMAADPWLDVATAGGSEHKVKMRLLSNLNRLPENENNNSNSHSFYAEYQFSSSRRGMFTLVSGLTQNYSLIRSNFHGNHWGLNIAGYSQLEAYPLHWLRGVAGFRVEEYILDGEATRPIPIFRTGVNITLAEATFLRASIGQGYRYPSVAEKHAYTTVGSIKILPNNEIKPESGWSSEAGVKQGFSFNGITGQADIAFFYSQNRNMIEYLFGYWFDVIAGEFTYGFMPTNIENSRVYGLETELMLNFSMGAISTTLTSGYTFMVPVEYNAVTGANTDKYLKFRRKHSADFNLTSAIGRFEAGANLTLKSKILDIDNVFVNPSTRETLLPGFYDYWMSNNTGYHVLDLFAAYRFGKVYQLSAGIRNVTNTEYMGRPGDIRPHRQFSLQISARF
ncbi:MAG: TonB-dependent receptor [Bacteroidales bacterium]